MKHKITIEIDLPTNGEYLPYEIVLGKYTRELTVDSTLVWLILTGLTLGLINYFGKQTLTDYTVAYNFVQFGVVWLLLDFIWPSKRFVPLTDKEVEEIGNVFINKDFEHIKFIPKPVEPQ